MSEEKIDLASSEYEHELEPPKLTARSKFNTIFQISLAGSWLLLDVLRDAPFPWHKYLIILTIILGFFALVYAHRRAGSPFSHQLQRFNDFWNRPVQIIPNEIKTIQFRRWPKKSPRYLIRWNDQSLSLISKSADGNIEEIVQSKWDELVSIITDQGGYDIHFKGGRCIRLYNDELSKELDDQLEKHRSN
ncbi:hypothetical protein [Persicirhabdus sediminis]|uniref:Uncharacterized protein n=1 Tax=Persicirhabdus sediminis TaxID=454144 RepID=A0A8J7MEJ2_9BACT|nr:hypothetical protein [Persicirhabdus sediminis]MBK1791942.1 hypothetical protein [Persicirhabdus sediminis]